MAVTEVFMPLMGEGIKEATLVRWLKKSGDKIEKDEPLLEVSTDKVDTEIPSPASGYLTATLAQEGKVVAVNDIIAHIADAMGETAGASSPKPKAASPSAAPATAVASKNPYASPSDFGVPRDGAKSSPLVRKMARDSGIDLTSVRGTGLMGRITKQDLLTHMEHPVPATIPATTLVAATTQTKAPVPVPTDSHGDLGRLSTTFVDGVEYLEGVPVRREKMGRMRSLIAKHMVESVRISPHVTTVFEIDLHKVVKIRERHMNAFQQREGFKLTYTPFFIHAAVEALKKFPELNVSVDGDDVLYKKDINMGCAVAIESGLIVPVIKKAGELSLLGIARRLNDLVTRARNKKLTPDDVQGGTFSITNPGGYGSLTSNPIISQPQVAIMGIGTVVKRPVVVENDMIAIRPMILISLTFDHRVVDGEGGAKYLATLKNILENYDYLPE